MLYTASTDDSITVTLALAPSDLADENNILKIVDQESGQAAVDELLRRWCAHILMDQIHKIQEDRFMKESSGDNDSGALSDAEFALLLATFTELFQKVGDAEKVKRCETLMASIGGEDSLHLYQETALFSETQCVKPFSNCLACHFPQTWINGFSFPPSYSIQPKSHLIAVALFFFSTS